MSSPGATGRYRGAVLAGFVRFVFWCAAARRRQSLHLSTALHFTARPRECRAVEVQYLTAPRDAGKKENHTTPAKSVPLYLPAPPGELTEV